jgi:selenide, water dikinase
VLLGALRGLEVYRDPNVMVGYETADDAGVYLLDDRTALVQTVDFFTPIVDDPFLFGQIAAANALSDIYAMGARPRFALSIVGFPKALLPVETLGLVMAGGASKMKEARVSILGGHSVQDQELKFGYAVTGVADPARIYTNRGARPGDVLLLTKPLGTGVVSTAIKRGLASPELVQLAIASMLQLNEAASEALDGYAVHALTDVTGYGLLGHAWELAAASEVTLRIDSASVPVFQGVLALAEEGSFPGAVEANRRLVAPATAWKLADPVRQTLLLDPQTSGGLLIAVASGEADRLEEKLRQTDPAVARIGTVAGYTGVFLEVL